MAPAGRTYDYQYFLTSAAGPWADLTWTYDRIGNRLSETEVGEPLPFTYSYSPNGMGGNTPKLTQIQPRPSDNGNGAITQSYDPTGNQTIPALRRARNGGGGPCGDDRRPGATSRSAAAGN